MDTTTSYERSSSTGWELGVEENTRFQLVIRCARAHSKSARSVSLLPPHPRRSGANKTVAPHHIPSRSRIWRYPYRASRCSLPSVPTLTMAPAGPAPLRNGPAAIRSKALPAGRILAVTILALLASGALSYLNPIARVRNDFLALTRKSTTRHIVLPKSTDAALKLKQKIRNRVADDGEFVVDAFEAAARRYSLDRETGERGGLLGELLPQGSVAACPELDEACFRVPLGDVYGPIESDFGYHLVLVSERTNCPKLDGRSTRVIRGPDGRTAVLAPPEGGYRTVSEEVSDVAVQQVMFWLGAFVAGGVIAEVAAKAADVVGANADLLLH